MRVRSNFRTWAAWIATSICAAQAPRIATILLVTTVVASAAEKPPLPSPWIETPKPVSVRLPAPHSSVRATLGLPADCNAESEQHEELHFDPDATEYESEGVTVDIRGMTPEGRLVRLAGPTYNWPGCGGRWCMMCTGIHMRSSAHGESYNYLNGIGSAQWLTHHDNLHNSGRARHSHSSYATAPTSARIETELRTTTTSATRWRLFGRWRR